MASATKAAASAIAATIRLVVDLVALPDERDLARTVGEPGKAGGNREERGRYRRGCGSSAAHQFEPAAGGSAASAVSIAIRRRAASAQSASGSCAGASSPSALAQRPARSPSATAASMRETTAVGERALDRSGRLDRDQRTGRCGKAVQHRRHSGSTSSDAERMRVGDRPGIRRCSVASDGAPASASGCSAVGLCRQAPYRPTVRWRRARRRCAAWRKRGERDRLAPRPPSWDRMADAPRSGRAAPAAPPSLSCSGVRSTGGASAGTGRLSSAAIRASSGDRSTRCPTRARYRRMRAWRLERRSEVGFERARLRFKRDEAAVDPAARPPRSAGLDRGLQPGEPRVERLEAAVDARLRDGVGLRREQRRR